MQMVAGLKKLNRTLLEMTIGLLFWGIACQIVGAFFVHEQGYYARSLWFGILFGLASLVHMYRTLDRALDFGEKDANKRIFRGYLFRYVLFAAVLIIIMITEVMNPLVVFLAYMGMKVAAYLQPFTHKLCNRIFHETDPVPQALPEETAGEPEIVGAPEAVAADGGESVKNVLPEEIPHKS